jgi:hypothetical protein
MPNRRRQGKKQEGVNTEVPWEVPKNWKPLTPDAFLVVNKGNPNKGTVRADKWVIRTEKENTGTRLWSNMPIFAGPAGARWVEGPDGIFASKAEAEERVPAFCRKTDGKRGRSKCVEMSCALTPAKAPSLDNTDQTRALKRKRNKGGNAVIKQEVLLTSLRKEVRGGVDTQLANKNKPVEQLKGGANLGVVANLFDQLSVNGHKARTAENKRRAETRAGESNKNLLQYLPMIDGKFWNMLKWSKARTLLALFLREITTYDTKGKGFNSTDLSNAGSARILKRAATAHVLCGLRLLVRTAENLVLIPGV